MTDTKKMAELAKAWVTESDPERREELKEQLRLLVHQERCALLKEGFGDPEGFGIIGEELLLPTIDLVRHHFDTVLGIKGALLLESHAQTVLPSIAREIDRSRFNEGRPYKHGKEF